MDESGEVLDVEAVDFGVASTSPGWGGNRPQRAGAGQQEIRLSTGGCAENLIAHMLQLRRAGAGALLGHPQLGG